MNQARFTEACKRGNLKLVKKLSNKVDVRAREDYAFRLACVNGHLEVAKFLKDFEAVRDTDSGIDYEAVKKTLLKL